MTSMKNNAAGQQRRYRQQRLRSEQEGAPNPIFWRVVLLVSLSFVIGLFFVRQTNNIETLQRKLTTLERSASEGNKEIDNIKMQLESYRSGSYILTKVEASNLKLCAPQAGQVLRVPSAPVGHTEYSTDGFTVPVDEMVVPAPAKPAPSPLRSTVSGAKKDTTAKPATAGAKH